MKKFIFILIIGIVLILIGYNQKNEKVSSFHNDNTTVTIIDLTKEETNYFNYYLFAGILLISASLIFLNKIFKNQKEVNINPLENLTSQEKKVVELINEEISNKEIADKLSISLSTLKTHINSIYKKLAIKSRAELLSSLKNKGD